ncbi:c-type cytochrome [Alienimonas chondri]|nr:cytochrome c [Alienimonas chondri]
MRRPIISAPPLPLRALSPFALAAALLLGCEPAPEPEFASPVGYDGLLEEMRTGTRAEVEDYDTGEMVERDLVGFDQALDERFGSPADPAVFTTLPVRFSSSEAAVIDVLDDEEAETTVFTLAPIQGAETVPAVAKGDVLHWNDEFGSPHEAVVAAVEGDAITVPLVPFEARPVSLPLGFNEETGEPLPGTVVIGDADLLEEGRELYAVHCLHCHGSTGAGDGPTAKYLHPLPRDYRSGMYKYTSTGTGIASRADLTRILRDGIPGTYMPSFHPALDAEKTASVVEYVRWLSMQGQYAKGVTDEAAFTYGDEAVRERLESEEGLTREDLVQELIEYWPDDVTGKLSFVGTFLAENWALAESEPPVTPNEPRPVLTGDELAASIERGKGLYLQKSTQCASCHGSRGLGNGPQTVSVQLDAATGDPYAEPGIHDVWGEVVQPRNLTRGIYRGGRRPIDLYRRIYSGIPASNMPGFGDNLSDEQIWDLVNFLMALPLHPSLLDGAELDVSHDDDAVAAARPALPPAAPELKADQS